MREFLVLWEEAARTSAGFFWMAFWAFALGYLISSLIQVLVTRQRMQLSMGGSGLKSVTLGAFFGFISSSCSFAALSTTRALFQKGAGLIPSLSFMLSSTNLVIELGIVIAIFLSWQFVAGEYIGGLLLIGFCWLFIRLTYPGKLIKNVRKSLQHEHDGQDNLPESWKAKIKSLKGWEEIGSKYVMEWQMVWRDVLIGFTVAGIISAFVPNIFFEHLFPGSGNSSQSLDFFSVLMQTIVGPIAAFGTFIGSMGNIPLAAILFDHGVSFAGVMAFIFSDLVVFPVLRINAQYYGWRMALYILAILLACIVFSAILMHYGFSLLGFLPDQTTYGKVTDRAFFQFNYGFVLNIIFLIVSAVLVWLWWSKQSKNHDMHHHKQTSINDYIMNGLVAFSIIWLIVGIALNII